MRVVALVPGGIGEQIQFFPTLESLKHHYPQAQIDVFVEPRAKGAYRVNKFVDQVFSFDFRDRNSLADWGNFVGMLRDREYDVAISYCSNWFVGLLLWLAGIPKRIGYKGKSSSFLTDTIERNTNQYAPQVYHDVLKLIGISTPAPELSLNLPKSDIDWVKAQEQRLGISDIGYVLIYPGNTSTTETTNNIYPVANWVQIMREFAQKQPEMSIIAIQEPDDIPLVREMKEYFPQLKIVITDNVGQLAAMIASANLLLCTESAILQIAIAVQTYTIVLTGAGRSSLIVPNSEKFLAIESSSSQIADIPPQTVSAKIWGG